MRAGFSIIARPVARASRRAASTSGSTFFGLVPRLSARFCLLLFPLSLAAQETTIQGRILDSQTRQALSGVTVRLTRTAEDSRTDESDAEGRFQFKGVEPGTYHAGAFRSGYEPIMSTAVEVSATDEEQEIVLSLKRYSVIAGRVIDRLGRPVAAARVTAYQKQLDQNSLELYWDNQDMRGFTHSLYRGFANDRGEYRMWGLSEGEFVVVAKPNPTPGPMWRLRFDAAPMFFPNSPSFDGASRIELGWGEVREAVDIQLGPPAATLQTGQILAAGEPCAKCSFSIFRKGGETDVNLAQGFTSPNGEFAIEGLPPGQYIVGGSARARHGPRALGLREFLISTEGDRPFALNLSDPVNIRGHVIFEDPPEAIPVPPESSAPFPQHNFARIHHLARDKEKLFFACQSDAPELYGDGAERFFEITAAPGHCRIRIAGPPGSYVAGMAIEGRPLERPELIIPPEGLAPGALNVRIRFDSGEIAGRVESSGSDAWVHLIPSGGDPFASHHPVRVEADGSFRARTAPGDWTVIATRSRNPSVWPEGSAERVEVKPNETTLLPSPLTVID